MKQNLTISLERDIIKRAKIFAAQKETSVTGLLSQYLKDILSEEEAYCTAKEKALNNLKKGYALGGRGMEREIVHER